MKYLIKISYPKANPKQKEIINKLFADEKLKKYIVRSNDNIKIIQPALFDYLEYNFFTTPAIISKARFSLLELLEDNKVKTLVDNCTLKSDDFNAILRELRF
jgi:hypothetical protein